MPFKAGARPSSPVGELLPFPFELLSLVRLLVEELCFRLVFLVTSSTVSRILLARRISLSLVG